LRARPRRNGAKGKIYATANVAVSTIDFGQLGKAKISTPLEVGRNIDFENETTKTGPMKSSAQ
jgi:hypothetical protein